MSLLFYIANEAVFHMDLLGSRKLSMHSQLGAGGQALPLMPKSLLMPVPTSTHRIFHIPAPPDHLHSAGSNVMGSHYPHG